MEQSNWWMKGGHCYLYVQGVTWVTFWLMHSCIFSRNCMIIELSLNCHQSITIIHNTTTLLYFTSTFLIFRFFFLNFPAYFCLNLLPSWPCLYLIPYNWDCAKSRSSKTPSIGELWLMIYQLVNFILEQFFIFYLSLHSKFHHFCWAAPVLHIILTRCSGCPSLPFFPKLDSP